MPETIINEFGQKVRVYDWEEYQKRLSQRKPWTGKEDLNGKNLVVKHTWGIGDILYSTPAMRGLKLKYPDCKITYICTHPDILENNPDIDRVCHWMEYDTFMEIGDHLNSGQEWYWLDYDVPLKGGYDYKLHLRSSPKLNEFMVSLLKKDPKLLGKEEREFVDQASSSVINRYRMIALDMYCWHAHVDPEEKSIYYYPYEHELEMARRFLAPIRKQGKKVITLIPHASTIYKDYPHWRKVIELSPNDCFWIIMDNHVRSSLWSGPNIADCSGAFKIRHSAAVIIEADLNCSSDTGLLYPRAARGKPCIVTYGPHEPRPFLYHFPSAHGMRVDHLRTTPGMEGMCSVGCYIDTQSCHKRGEAAPCLNELSPQAIADKIRQLTESNS